MQKPYTSGLKRIDPLDEVTLCVPLSTMSPAPEATDALKFVVSLLRCIYPQ